MGNQSVATDTTAQIRSVLVGLVVTSATAEQEILGSIPGLDKVLMDFSTSTFLVHGHVVWIFARLISNKLASYYM